MLSNTAELYPNKLTALFTHKSEKSPRSPTEVNEHTMSHIQLGSACFENFSKLLKYSFDSSLFNTC